MTSFTYQFIPSSRDTSRFSLSCNFDQLASAYPEFHHELEELKKRRKGHHDNYRSRAAEEQTINQSGVAENNIEKGSAALSSQVNHSFNAALTRALLHSHFELYMPSLPEGRLCPPVPNRCNYVSWLKHLLLSNSNDLYRFCNAAGQDGLNDLQYNGIDIGTGVSAIYPLLLTTKLFAKSSELTCEAQSTKWTFLATDIDPVAIESASKNVQANHLQDEICVALVKEYTSALTCNVARGPLFAAMEVAKEESMFQNGNGGKQDKLDDGYPKFDFVMTNPPFYETVEEVTTPRAGDKRSRTDISINEGVFSSANVSSEGGDVGFVESIIRDSSFFQNYVTWYTSLIAKRSSLDAIYQKLQKVEGIWGNRGQIRTVEFQQDNMKEEIGESNKTQHSPRVRWGIAWTFERAVGRVSSCRVRGGLKSFYVSIPINDGIRDAVNEVSSRLITYFSEVSDVSLKCIDGYRERNTDDKSNGGPKDRCITVIEARFSSFVTAPTSHHEQDNRNLPCEGHFVIDAFVSIKRQSSNGDVDVEVSLEAFAHTTYGAILVNKIRGGQMPGEIGRTNRKWRRLLRRQLASPSTSTPATQS
jgi:23S rRNA (adenine1618-N6)-methyltransferase